MADTHPPAFLALVDDAKTRIQEIHARDLAATLAANPAAKLIDVREESEYAAGHVSNAEWLGKGVIERDIEHACPDGDEELVLYCGGGFRSALAADALQKMGYRKVCSLAGGWRAWVAGGGKVQRDS